ncbi:MAG: hypothetical protein ACJA13_000378 [Paraglaciecola sp.]|jgi:hypothetical protein
MKRSPDYILLKLTLCLLCLCLFGFTSMPPTSYQAAQTSGDNSFSHVKLSNNQFRVLFSGNKTTDETMVKDYALLHAAELTQQQDFDWFMIVDSDTVVETKTVTRVGPTPITQIRGKTTCGLLGCTPPPLVRKIMLVLRCRESKTAYCLHC